MEKFEEISPADFFYRSKEIAGFENPTKACYTVVRELIENSLDSCESGNFLPYIKVIIKNLDENKNSEENKLSIKVIDNGIGIPYKHVPFAFGKVLYGSKFILKQQRGIFGLGGKMAILYGQITTNSPVNILTATPNSNFIHFFKIGIDIQKNEPIIFFHKKIENNNKWHGLVINFNFLGNYRNSKKKILEYLFQTYLISPHLNLVFIDFEGDYLVFERKTESMPKRSEETLPHPKGVDLEFLKRLIKAYPHLTLLKFLTRKFQKIGLKTALEIIDEIKLNPESKVNKLSDENIIKLYEILKNYNFKRPSPKSLSPLGKNLIIGIKEIFNPEFISYNSRKPSSYEGHPFIIETAIAYGGKIHSKGENEFNLFRFANKIPLIYDSYHDVSTKVIKGINWNIYKINIYQEPVAFFIHICSTKIPYKTIGKEYIASHPEIYKEIKLSLKRNIRELSKYLTKKKTIEYQKLRFKHISSYLEKIVSFACKLSEMEENKLKPFFKSILKENGEKRSTN